MIEHIGGRSSRLPAVKPVRWMVSPVRAYSKIGFARQQSPFPLQSESPTILTRAAAILYQAVTLDPHRVFRFGLLDGNIAGYIGDIAEPVISISVGTCAPGPGHQLIVNVRHRSA